MTLYNLSCSPRSWQTVSHWDSRNLTNIMMIISAVLITQVCPVVVPSLKHPVVLLWWQRWVLSSLQVIINISYLSLLVRSLQRLCSMVNLSPVNCEVNINTANYVSCETRCVCDITIMSNVILGHGHWLLPTYRRAALYYYYCYLFLYLWLGA